MESFSTISRRKLWNLALLLFGLMCQKMPSQERGWCTLTEEKCGRVVICFQGTMTLRVLCG